MASVTVTPPPALVMPPLAVAPSRFVEELEVVWDGRGSLPGYRGLGLGSSLAPSNVSRMPAPRYGDRP